MSLFLAVSNGSQPTSYGATAAGSPKENLVLSEVHKESATANNSNTNDKESNDNNTETKTMINYIARLARNQLQRIQEVLEFKSWSEEPQFNNNQGLGRVALIACILCFILGSHLVLLCLLLLHQTGITTIDLLLPWLSSDRSQLLIQWFLYVIFIVIFHLAEFFTTALYNPSVASSDSFIVNHSHSYTVAAILSSIEFFLRFLFLPKLNNVGIMYLGLFIVIIAQSIRTTAIATCGESFNHLIQTSKKDNHVLITHGIYKYFRHPSYVGFFYWSIGTQLLLCNPLHILLFTFATWWFFQRRIPFEEESLKQHFPDTYSSYASRTYIGIPFIRT